MGLFDRAQDTLEGILQPTRVHLQGTVATAVRVESPLTHLHGALFHWTFYVNRKPTILPLVEAVFEATRRSGEADPLNRTPRLEHLATVIWGDDLFVEVGGKTIHITTDKLVARFHGAREPVPLECTLPPELLRLDAFRQADSAVIYYVEHSLLSGDRVSLDATIEPLTPGGGAYRSAGAVAAHFDARADLGSILLEDRSLET
jgi:hypothetical protein